MPDPHLCADDIRSATNELIEEIDRISGELQDAENEFNSLQDHVIELEQRLESLTLGNGGSENSPTLQELQKENEELKQIVLALTHKLEEKLDAQS